MTSNVSLLDSPLLTDLQDIYSPRSPLAQALFSLGMEPKAYRADYCGSTRYKQCAADPSHQHKQTRTCMLKCCRQCALRRMERYIEALVAKLSLLPSDRYYAITVTSDRIEHFPSQPEVKEYNSRISRWLRSHEADAISHLTIVPRTDFPDHYNLVCRVLWLGQLPADTTRQAPGVISYSIVTEADLPTTVKYLFDWTPPTDPMLAAEYELSTSDLRVVRQYGALYGTPGTPDLIDQIDQMEGATEEGEDRLVASTPDIATNPFAPLTKTSDLCPKCGSHFSKVSEWVDPYLPPALLKDIRWYDIDQPIQLPPLDPELMALL